MRDSKNNRLMLNAKESGKNADVISQTATAIPEEETMVNVSEEREETSSEGKIEETETTTAETKSLTDIEEIEESRTKTTVSLAVRDVEDSDLLANKMREETEEEVTLATISETNQDLTMVTGTTVEVGTSVERSSTENKQKTPLTTFG